jgi:hypothetical protein
MLREGKSIREPFIPQPAKNLEFGPVGGYSKPDPLREALPELLSTGRNSAEGRWNVDLDGIKA